jgi:hypothetical protein
MLMNPKIGLLRRPRRHAHHLIVVLLGQLFFGAVTDLRAAGPQSYLLDADTPTTGSNLATTPLTTPFGTITFAGDIIALGAGDPEFNAAGASGNVFDIEFNTPAQLLFSFDVSAITFIYGGNVGVFNAQARDVNGVIVSTFFQASTDVGQPAGPITMTGPGIRRLTWSDPMRSFCAIDNVRIDVAVPEPGGVTLLLASICGTHLVRRRSAEKRR